MPQNIIEIKNSKVLIRVGWDLPDLTYASRILDSLETIKLLLKNQNQLFLLTHWGRPKGMSDSQKSTRKILKTANQVFLQNQISASIQFWNQYADDFNPANFPDAKIILLENTRFHSSEKSKDAAERKVLAQKYVKLADFFVDEAFSVSHRNEATNSEISELLPSFKGLSFEKEIANLTELKNNPQKPFMAVMAGSKLKTKLPIIQRLLPLTDKIFLGGKLAFTFIQVIKDKNLVLNQDSCLVLPKIFESEIDTDFYETAFELLQKYPEKLVLPIDFAVDNLFGKQEVFDVGPKTVKYFQDKLKSAKTIFWNGTLGYYEQKPFDQATLGLANFVANLTDTKTIIGGGDTCSAIPSETVEKFSFASMGGGATLEFLAKK